MTNATLTHTATAQQVARVTALSTADLVAEYNSLSGKAPIKAFHTRGKGEAQVLKLLGTQVTVGTRNPHPERQPGAVTTSVTIDKAHQMFAQMGAALSPEDAEEAAIAAAKAAKQASTTSKAPKAAGAAKAAAVGTFALSSTITLLVAANPKRGASAARYALYKDGMTVDAYLKAGGLRADLSWDSAVSRKFITIKQAAA